MRRPREYDCEGQRDLMGINSAAMNIGVHFSLSLLVSSVCMPSSGIAGSYAAPALKDLTGGSFSKLSHMAIGHRVT